MATDGPRGSVSVVQRLNDSEDHKFRGTDVLEEQRLGSWITYNMYMLSSRVRD